MFGARVWETFQILWRKTHFRHDSIWKQANLRRAQTRIMGKYRTGEEKYQYQHLHH
jgi:hypothetical protein